eukprot:10163154-Alexandrium_andersonii.AAC.1
MLSSAPARVCTHCLRAAPRVRPGAVPWVRPGVPRVRPWPVLGAHAFELVCAPAGPAHACARRLR